MANTNTEIIAMLETDPSQAIRGVLDTLYLYNPATVNDLIAQLNDVIAKVGFEAIVVDTLPETGKNGTIYLVPSGGETPNVYNEYVWVAETEKFEMVGSAQVDLSNYYTKDEVDNLLDDVLPDQTDNADKFLTTDGTTASWSNKPLVNNARAPTHQIAISGTTTSTTTGNIVVGQGSSSSKAFSIAIGYNCKVSAEGGILLNARGISPHYISQYSELKEAYSFYVGLGGATNGGLYKLLGRDGTIPTDRYTTTPTTAGTYVPKLTIAEDGTATREWGTESGGGVSGDYLPLSGGTMTGEVIFNSFGQSSSYVPIIRNSRTGELSVSVRFDNGNYYDICSFNVAGGYIVPNSDNQGGIGAAGKRWREVYTTKLNNGADLAVPTEGGTLARLEDLDNIYVATIKEYD